MDDRGDHLTENETNGAGSSTAEWRANIAEKDGEKDSVEGKIVSRKMRYYG